MVKLGVAVVATTVGAIFLSTIVDVKEVRDAMSTDIPNAFVHAKCRRTRKPEQNIMKITEVLVD
jgi:hypothetical protein